MLADAAVLVLFDDREQADDETTRPAWSRPIWRRVPSTHLG
jgi:hypothetical protein